MLLVKILLVSVYYFNMYVVKGKMLIVSIFDFALQPNLLILNCQLFDCSKTFSARTLRWIHEILIFVVTFYMR